jgi:hypothetical protein
MILLRRSSGQRITFNWSKSGARRRPGRNGVTFCSSLPVWFRSLWADSGEYWAARASCRPRRCPVLSGVSDVAAADFDDVAVVGGHDPYERPSSRGWEEVLEPFLTAPRQRPDAVWGRSWRDCSRARPPVTTARPLRYCVLRGGLTVALTGRPSSDIDRFEVSCAAGSSATKSDVPDWSTLP